MTGQYERSLATILSPIANVPSRLFCPPSRLANVPTRLFCPPSRLARMFPREHFPANVLSRRFPLQLSRPSREWYHVVKFSSALLVRMRTWDLVARVVLSVKSENCRVMINREEKKKQLARILKSMSSSDDRLERAITALG